MRLDAEEDLEAVSPEVGAAQSGSAGGTTLAEATLVGRAQDGDINSFETLVRRYSAPMMRLAQRLLNDHCDAEDVVQDTFILAWRRLPGLGDPEKFRSWLYAIATRQSLSLMRTRGRRATVPVEDPELAEATSGASTSTEREGEDPAHEAERSATRRGLDAALAELPDEQRACWVLREMHDQSYDDIARATELPVSTVRGRIARARQNLVKGMDGWR